MANSRNLKDVTVVLINVDECEGAPREALNAIESEGFESTEELLETLHRDHAVAYESIFTFTLSEFMEEYNDDTRNVDNSFFGYVQIKQ